MQPTDPNPHLQPPAGWEMRTAHPTHAVPNVAGIGAGLVAAGVPPHEVPDLVANIQRIVTAAVADSIATVVNQIQRAQHARMHQIGALIQRVPAMGYAAPSRDALFALLGADPVAMDQALLAAAYQPDDWQKALNRATTQPRPPAAPN